MTISSILFSKEHLLNPFEITYKKEKISIEDQKTKVIGLSILIGIFTFGVGGIFAFYYLTARYKIKILEVDNIKYFVGAFLHPYIHGEITEANECKNRKPMIEILQSQMPNAYHSKKEICDIALKSFIESSILGFYIHKGLNAVHTNMNLRNEDGSKLDSRKIYNIKLPDITPDSPDFEILERAIKSAVDKEFPNHNIAARDLTNKIRESLVFVNAKRKKAQEKALNYQVHQDVTLRLEKIENIRRGNFKSESFLVSK